MKRMNQRYFILLVSVIGILLTACEQNKHRIDVSNVDLTLNIQRFDTDLFAIDTAKADQGCAALKQNYPEFYQLYFRNILGLAKMPDSLYPQVVKEIISNASFRELIKDCDSVYPNLNTLQAQLTDAFKHYRYYYPKAQIPTITTFLDEFGFGIVTGDSCIGIGLHLFLGQNYKYYSTFNYPMYLTRRFTPAYILPNAMKAFATAQFTYNNTDKSLLNKIIYEGKMLYFLDAMMPETPDSVKIGYTADQLEWCKAYQADIWASFIESKVLYSSNIFEYSKYIEEAPFTPGQENDSAPRIGIWTGWQIVRKYMDENPTVTLPQLMAETDYKKILKLAKYKPKN